MAISSVLGSSALLPAGLGFRNVLINGAMNVAQRSTSVASLSSPAGTYHTVDRWNTFLSSAGTYTQSQSTDAPPGFGYSLKMQCTTASGSLAAGAYGQIQQIIEGQNVQQFAKGTSSAKPFAVSFWVKAFQTGTYVVELYDATNTRSVSRTYTVNTAETWEYKTIQFPADATGAFANSNAGALIIVHWFSGGTTYTGGTANGSWAAASNGNRAAGLTVNVGSSTSNYWQITGVQLEQNYQPTPFEQRPIGVELALCQRYYEDSVQTVGVTGSYATGLGGNTYFSATYFKVTKRISPSATNGASETPGNIQLIDNDGIAGGISLYRAGWTRSTIVTTDWKGTWGFTMTSLGSITDAAMGAFRFKYSAEL